MDTHNQWLRWAKQLQAIAQNGLYFSQDNFDRERYEQIRHLSAEILAHHSEHNVNKVEAIFANETGYATPKIDVRGVVFKDKKILLVREQQDGRWSLPGGWVDAGDAPSVAIEKEIVQESGFIAKAVKLLALYDKLQHPYPPQWPHIYKAFFLCEIIGGEPHTSIETTAVDFFALDNLPPLSLHRIIPEHIHRMYELVQDPQAATDFD